MAALWLFLGAALGTASAFTPGCLITGMRFIDPVYVNPNRTAGATACQNLCEADVLCSGFTYYPNSGECWPSASGSGSKLAPQEPGVPAYAGPKTCPDHSIACPASLVGDWPKSTAAESNAAFNTGYQPGVLQCWPKTTFNGSYGSCSEVSTLDDTATGWPGKCLGLAPKTLVGSETCEGTCLADLTCPGFQIGSDGSCWQGLGEGCFNDAPWNYTWLPTSAKRFQRGTVHKVKDLVGVQVQGLQKVFDKANADAMADAAKQCAHVCYSVLECQYWQLDNVSGCWIEGPDVSPLPYPLTTASLLYDTSYAANMVAGEFIQRVCSSAFPTTVATTTTTTTTTTEGAGGFPWWGWLLIALLLLCCICAILAYVLGGQKPKKAKKSKRALSTSAPVANPVPTMQTAMPVYTQAPVYTATPVYTVPAPVRTVAVPVAAPVAAPVTTPAASVAISAPLQVSREVPMVVSAPMASQPMGVAAPVAGQPMAGFSMYAP